MDRRTFLKSPPHRGAASGFKFHAHQMINVFVRKAVVGFHFKDAALARARNVADIRFTEARSRFNQGAEHRFQIERGSADHLQHISGCSLLLQRFAQLIKQPRVLYGNHGLCGKVFYQFGLLVRKWPHLLTVDDDGTNEIVLLEHWNREQRSRAGEISQLNKRKIPIQIGLICPNIGNVFELLGLGEPSEWICWSDAEYWVLLPFFGVGQRCSVHSYHSVAVPLHSKHRSELGVTNLDRLFQHSVEDRLQLPWRTADDLKNVGGCGLLLERLAQLAKQSRVLDGDDGLGSKVREQRDLLVGERPHLLAIHVNRADKLAVLEHWHRHKGPRAHGIDEGNNKAIFPDVGLIGPQVGNVDNLFGGSKTVEWHSRIIAQVDHRITP